MVKNFTVILSKLVPDLAAWAERLKVIVEKTIGLVSKGTTQLLAMIVELSTQNDLQVADSFIDLLVLLKEANLLDNGIILDDVFSCVRQIKSNHPNNFIANIIGLHNRHNDKPAVYLGQLMQIASSDYSTAEQLLSIMLKLKQANILDIVDPESLLELHNKIGIKNIISCVVIFLAFSQELREGKLSKNTVYHVLDNEGVDGLDRLKQALSIGKEKGINFTVIANYILLGSTAVALKNVGAIPDRNTSMLSEKSPGMGLA